MVVIPTRVEAFPTQSVSATLLVPGRKDFAASQFDYEGLSQGLRPTPLPPEKTPSAHVLRPNHTYPHPAWSITFPDPEFLTSHEANKPHIRLRTLVHETLELKYAFLSDLEYLYLSYWVTDQLSSASPESDIILEMATRWPGFHLSSNYTIGGRRPQWEAPKISATDDTCTILLLEGFGGQWAALDCGDNIIFGAAGNRRNACVFKALGRVLPLTDWLICLQTLRLAADFHKALPARLPKATPPRFSDFVKRTRDLAIENAPFDPMTLVVLSPPCLHSYRIVFIFVPSSSAESDTSPQIIVLSPASGATPTSTGFILLYERQNPGH